MAKRKNTGPFSASDIRAMKSRTDTKRIDAMRDSDIDVSDIPPLSAAFWEQVKLLKPAKKELISLRVDKETADWFRAQGAGYQAYMNAVLKSFVASRPS
jgi:uncharacterized protein (DUF4415 family)